MPWCRSGSAGLRYAPPLSGRVRSSAVPMRFFHFYYSVTLSTALLAQTLICGLIILLVSLIHSFCIPNTIIFRFILQKLILQRKNKNKSQRYSFLPRKYSFTPRKYSYKTLRILQALWMNGGILLEAQYIYFSPLTDFNIVLLAHPPFKDHFLSLHTILNINILTYVFICAQYMHTTVFLIYGPQTGHKHSF